MADKSKRSPGKSTSTRGGPAQPASPSRQPRGNAAAQAKLAGGATNPYSSVYGKGSSKDPNFKVDRGQLTFDAEGTEGGRFHSRKAHVPPGPSGVTIGRGYDLGQHTAAQIVADLVSAGLPERQAKRWSAAAGLKGERAAAWVKANGKLVSEITPEQQERLFNKTYAEMSGDVQRISKKPSVVSMYGATKLEKVNPAIRDTLVDLRYRGDYTGSAREKVQGAAADNDLLDMTDSLTDRGQWKNVPEDRFRRRAAYLREEEEQVEGAAYGFNGMPMEPHSPSLAELQAAEQAGKKGRGGQ